MEGVAAVSADVGDVLTLWAAFRDQTGAQAAPTAVVLTVRKPDGTSSVVANSAASAPDETLAETATGQMLSGVTGVYKATLTIDQAGTWRYRWAGTGAVAEMEQGVFMVRRDRVTA